MNGPAADDEASTRSEEWARLSLLVERADDELAIAELTRFLDHHPEHARARFVLGRTLLARDSDRGIEALEQAMADDPRIVPAACALIRDHLQRSGRASDAKPYQSRAHDAGELLERATRERAAIDHTTPLLPHSLNASQLGDLRAIFDRHAGVRYVDIARARLSHLPQIPVYLIAVTLDTAWFEGEAKAARAIEDVLPIGVDIACFVVRSNRRRLAKHVASQTGARVYEKRS
jgi:hypothetical protein